MALQIPSFQFRRSVQKIGETLPGDWTVTGD